MLIGNLVLPTIFTSFFFSINWIFRFYFCKMCFYCFAEYHNIKCDACTLEKQPYCAFVKLCPQLYNSKTKYFIVPFRKCFPFFNGLLYLIWWTDKNSRKCSPHSSRLYASKKGKTKPLFIFLKTIREKEKSSRNQPSLSWIKSYFTLIWVSGKTFCSQMTHPKSEIFLLYP